MKLAIVYNFAAHYRQGIFEQIDRFYECDWFFGRSNSDIKKLDYSVLRGKIKEIGSKRVGCLCWQVGILKLLGCQEYSNYLLFAQTKDVSTWVFAFLAKHFYPKKNVFFWSHGYYGKESYLERLIKRQLFKLPNGGTFLYGNYARDIMIKHGLDPQHLYVIHNSLDYKHQLDIRHTLHFSTTFLSHFKNDHPTLVFVGRLTPIKKLDLAIKALGVCHEQGHYYNFVLVGGGEMMQELQDLTLELGLSGNVWFYGPCYDERVLGGLIYNADLCVSPGNVGLTAMHSMVFGTPVLTHNNFSHQMPEFEAIIPGKTGDFFEEGSVSSLARKIMDWLAVNGDKREMIRKYCFDEIDRSWTPDYQLSVIKQHIHHE